MLAALLDSVLLLLLLLLGVLLPVLLAAILARVVLLLLPSCISHEKVRAVLLQDPGNESFHGVTSFPRSGDGACPVRSAWISLGRDLNPSGARPTLQLLDGATSSTDDHTDVFVGHHHSLGDFEGWERAMQRRVRNQRCGDKRYRNLGLLKPLVQPRYKLTSSGGHGNRGGASGPVTPFHKDILHQLLGVVATGLLRVGNDAGTDCWVVRVGLPRNLNTAPRPLLDRLNGGATLADDEADCDE